MSLSGISWAAWRLIIFNFHFPADANSPEPATTYTISFVLSAHNYFSRHILCHILEELQKFVPWFACRQDRRSLHSPYQGFCWKQTILAIHSPLQEASPFTLVAETRHTCLPSTHQVMRLSPSSEFWIPNSWVSDKVRIRKLGGCRKWSNPHVYEVPASLGCLPYI